MNPGIEIIRFAVAVYTNRDETIDKVPVPLDQPCHLARVKPLADVTLLDPDDQWWNIPDANILDDLEIDRYR